MRHAHESLLAQAQLLGQDCSAVRKRDHIKTSTLLGYLALILTAALEKMQRVLATST